MIAFLKLNGNMGGKPILLPQRHAINLGVLLAIAWFAFGFWHGQYAIDFWLVTALAFVLGFLLDRSRSAARTCRSWCRC